MSRFDAIVVSSRMVVDKRRAAMATVEDVSNRVSRLEGAYDHLATKADLKDLELRLTVRLGGLMITGFAIVIAVLRFWE